jgi:hypothetical protein
MPECRIIRHWASPVPDWKKLTMPGPVRYRTKATQSGIFWSGTGLRWQMPEYRCRRYFSGCRCPPLRIWLRCDYLINCSKLLTFNCWLLFNTFRFAWHELNTSLKGAVSRKKCWVMGMGRWKITEIKGPVYWKVVEGVYRYSRWQQMELLDKGELKRRLADSAWDWDPTFKKWKRQP